MDTINGFPIIATFPTRKDIGTRAGRLIIVDRGEQFEERYVLSWQGMNDDGSWCGQWSGGCYCETLEEARGGFLLRVQREVL